MRFDPGCWRVFRYGDGRLQSPDSLAEQAVLSACKARNVGEVGMASARRALGRSELLESNIAEARRRGLTD